METQQPIAGAPAAPATPTIEAQIAAVEHGLRLRLPVGNPTHQVALKAAVATLRAVPVLVAALEAVCRDGDWGREHGDPFPPWYEQAHVALAAARGQL